MTTFTVWRFDSPEGAEHAVSVLRDASADGLVQIVDHAVVSWPPGDRQPSTKHAHDDAKHGAGWGALWGVLAGALFLVPLIGGAVGAAIGALSKATEGTGITRDDLERIRTGVVEGTSALFLVTDEGDLDRLGERVRGMDMTLVSTNLTDAERDVLMETFGGA